jgi:dipeptide/tripeptide permease
LLLPPSQVYITPLLGAYLADAVMGRFWVILVFSLIYFVVRVYLS